MPDALQTELTRKPTPEPVEDTARWPEWAEEARLDDELTAKAYEATPPSCRAALKTGLALAHMHFGQSLGCLREERRDGHLGFWRHRASFPAPWAVLAFTPEYAAAARLTAACVPALLANVPLVGAVCVGGMPHGAALVSLELSGVEDIFRLDDAGLCALLEESQPGPGRLVLLHKGELDSVAHTARVLGLPCYEERRAPALILPEPEAFDLDILCLHKDLLPEAARGHCRAHRHGPFRYTGSLALSPGCEGFWLHEGLTPDFFTVSRQAFGPL
ncbi:MAG: hypothetical protein KH208_08290 [Desulfovibrio sp.]|uniref:hypothetical protein n=1 Tax=Desulfovibrio sp. TaxID=885 RepID=UPI0025B97B65|nr:hypothetical protein [Desulfovibrio sp.]MBS6829852.1 hypothetical protein [Desulfovibrio sp.]